MKEVKRQEQGGSVNIKNNNMKIDWINGYKATNKSEKYELNIRIGTMTVLEIKLCLCETKKCSKFRFMMFNLGFEL